MVTVKEDKMFSLRKKINRPLLIAVFFVYADIMCENLLVMINDSQTHSASIVLLFVFLTMQIIFAPLQSGFSDFYGRKKSLIASLSISLIALGLCLVFSLKVLPIVLLLFFATALKGVWGNTIPIAFAVIADTQDKDYRGSFAIASSMYALSYITLIMMGFLSLGEKSLICIVGISLIASLFICIFYLEDPKDSSAHLPYKLDVHQSSKIIPNLWKIGKKEVCLINNELKRPLTKIALFSHFLWETSMYIILISQVDFNKGKVKTFVLLMMIGYLSGIAILKMKPIAKMKDRSIIKLGYFTSFLSLVPYFLFVYFTDKTNLVLGVCYYLHAMGNAFLSPTILSILVKKRSVHDQGKILGLVESFDTIAFLVSTVLVIIYTVFKFPQFILISASFIRFTISWVFYKTLTTPLRKSRNT